MILPNLPSTTEEIEAVYAGGLVAVIALVQQLLLTVTQLTSTTAEAWEVSGRLCSLGGAEAFYRIRGYISTSRGQTQTKSPDDRASELKSCVFCGEPPRT